MHSQIIMNDRKDPADLTVDEIMDRAPSDIRRMLDKNVQEYSVEVAAWRLAEIAEEADAGMKSADLVQQHLLEARGWAAYSKIILARFIGNYIAVARRVQPHLKAQRDALICEVYGLARALENVAEPSVETNQSQDPAYS